MGSVQAEARRLFALKITEQLAELLDDAPARCPDDAFMVKRLPGYSPDLAGRIVYPAAFDALGY